MISVQQTVNGPQGNCFSACLASLFELPIAEVPNFYAIDASDDGWWAAVRDWLRHRGFGVMFLELRSPDHLKLFEGYLIVSGVSKRGLHHATIWQNGKMVHDPHPDSSGLETIEGIDMIYPLSPATLTHAPAAAHTPSTDETSAKKCAERVEGPQGAAIEWDTVSVRVDKWKRLQALCEELEPHEHHDGMNECQVCDEPLTDTLIRHCEGLLAIRAEIARRKAKSSPAS